MSVPEASECEPKKTSFNSRLGGMGKAAEMRGEGIHIGLAEHREQYINEMNKLLASATLPSGKLNLGEMSLQGKGIYIGPMEQKQANLSACSDRIESNSLLTCTDRRCGKRNLGEMSTTSRTEGTRKKRAENRRDPSRRREGGGEEGGGTWRGLQPITNLGDTGTAERRWKGIYIGDGTEERAIIKKLNTLLLTWTVTRCGKLTPDEKSLRDRRDRWWRQSRTEITNLGDTGTAERRREGIYIGDGTEERAIIKKLNTLLLTWTVTRCGKLNPDEKSLRDRRDRWRRQSRAESKRRDASQRHGGGQMVAARG